MTYLADIVMGRFFFINYIKRSFHRLEQEGFKCSLIFLEDLLSLHIITTAPSSQRTIFVRLSVIQIK